MCMHMCACVCVCKSMCCVLVHVRACAYLRAEKQGPTEVTVQIDRHSVPFSVPGCRGWSPSLDSDPRGQGWLYKYGGPPISFTVL